MDNEFNEPMKLSNYMTVYRNGISYDISPDDFWYIKGEEVGTTVYTKDFEYTSEYSINTWKEILDKEVFFQSQRKYIININHLRMITRYAAHFEGEIHVPLSIGYKRPIEKKYFMIYWEEMRKEGYFEYVKIATTALGLFGIFGCIIILFDDGIKEMIAALTFYTPLVILLPYLFWLSNELRYKRYKKKGL